MEEVYGKQVYAKSGHPNWKKVSEKPRYITVAKQGSNQCGYYCLKFASMFDGDRVVEQIDDLDVCYFLYKCIVL
jgi:hypothetical protein